MSVAADAATDESYGAACGTSEPFALEKTLVMLSCPGSS